VRIEAATEGSAAAPPPSSSRQQREPELDGLRAIAATQVLLFHCLSAVGATTEVQHWLITGPPAAVANGASAVVLFFVLSGYVLAGSFLRDASALGAGAFLVRRMLRLYPAFLAALAAAWLVSMIVPHFDDGAGQSAWLRAHAQLRLSAGQLLLSALAPGAAYELVPVGWTLRLELIYSLLFPMLMVIALRTHVAVLVLPAALSLLLTPSRLINYAFPFTVGIAMYACRERIHASDRGVRAIRWPLLLVAAGGYLLPPTHLWPASRLLGMGLATLGAASLMLLARMPPLAPLLRSPAMVRLGEISYSLYLLHVPVVLLVAPWLLGGEPAEDAATATMRWLLVGVAVLPLTIVAASFVHRTIELPGIEAGRRLGRRITALQD